MTFVPVRQLIDDVTNEVNAEVTTVDDHGYLTGYVVRVIVPQAYGMNIYEQTKIVVTGTKTFTTTIDTSWQNDFVAPTFVANGQGFTEAQVIPISGTTDNVS
jgi:hypothetical protein